MSESNAPTVAAAAAPERGGSRWIVFVALLLLGACAAALGLAWNTQQHVRQLEKELVRRQGDSDARAAEALLLARQAQDVAREAAARTALVDARVADATLQRSQLEELIQSLSRSREENVLAEIELSLRLAMQQSAISGRAEPLVLVLEQSDERLARHSQPQLQRVRRAVTQDLEQLRAAGAVDIAALAARLDEAVRLVDDLPLLSAPQPRANPRAAAAAASAAAPHPAAASAPGEQAPASAAPPGEAAADGNWPQRIGDTLSAYAQRVWVELRGLIRITPVEQPEAMLLAPQQAQFLRENLKLRLLNSRLALLSRQFDTVQSDLREAQTAIERYFDRGSRRVQGVLDLLRQVRAQAHTVSLPRPDATLAAISAVSAGR